MLTKNLYRKFIEKDLSLGDQLAAARSILANERTYLSYQRTAITILIAGLTFIRFFDVLWIEIIGWFFLPAAFVTMLLGTYRYAKMRDLIKNIEIKSVESNGNNNSKN
ncbi:MAG: hypothetical protein A2X61_05195 [Ignavibacteria bacterium GWB2_35_12]|nr:MAG: hypothetical protein A2X63_08705 [Ignavibacteria bacterium GWA2_35_8]OGU41549.1 MAG: hypothetical protein A2X61_05195 [Ignavibacteria bacterium GWB2_35_12]OGU94838.1 MAG: hypothetical protein A2220_12250 [Ignavibacteria bacterium RIFOXYA2_FULL_35_10]OGV21484.1 MAG: hypothetical protein A2475_13840 [Ignavibacteria bacterium RIFOXYC2_FULL_35_21]